MEEGIDRFVVRRGREQLSISEAFPEVHQIATYVAANPVQIPIMEAMGRQSSIYGGRSGVDGQTGYMYERFLDLLQSGSEGSGSLLQSETIRKGNPRKRRDARYKQNVEAFFSMLVPLYWRGVGTKIDDEQLKSLKHMVTSRAVVSGADLLVGDLAVFKHLIRGRQEIQQSELQYQDAPEQQPRQGPFSLISRWLGSQLAWTSMQISRENRGQQVIRFAQELFSIPAGQSSQDQQELLYDIQGYRPKRRTFAGEVKLFVSPNDRVINGGQPFLLDINHQDITQILWFHCVLAVFPIIYYAILPWLMLKLLLLQGRKIEYDQQRAMQYADKVYGRHKIVGHLGLSRLMQRRPLFYGETQSKIGQLIANIMASSQTQDIDNHVLAIVSEVGRNLGYAILNYVQNMDKQRIQHYLQQDVQDYFLSVSNVYARAGIAPVQVPIYYTRLDSQSRNIIHTLRPIFSSVIPLAQPRFNWNFYGRRRVDIRKTPIEIPQVICQEEVNKQLRLLAKPEIDFSQLQNPVQDLSAFCQMVDLNLEVVGFRQMNVDRQCQYTLRLAPRHIQLVRSKPYQSGWKTKMAATYIPGYSRHASAWDISGPSPITKDNWQIGLDLPLDSTLDSLFQKGLRKNNIVIDIQALSVQESKQIAYMICVVGYLGVQTRTAYISFSNVQTETYVDGIRQTVSTGKSIYQQCCISNFCQWLAKISHNYTRDDPLRVWGFNSMNYEIAYVLPQLVKSFSSVQLLGQPSQAKGIRVADGRIQFCDILKILPAKSLRQLTKQFQTVIQKDNLDIGFYNNWPSVQVNYQNIKRYCYIDCVSTILLVHKVQVSFAQIAKSINMQFQLSELQTKTTASSIGWYFFIQGFFKRGIQNQSTATSNNFANNQPQQVYQYQRRSYCGGVVQVWRHFYEGQIYVVDVNSMYPAMLLQDLPWVYRGEVRRFVLEELLQQPQSDLYLFKIGKYSLPVDFLGAFIPTKQIFNSSKNTYYNDYQGDELFLRGVAVKRILHHGGHVFVDRVWRYASQGITAFKQFGTTFYNKRCQQKKDSFKSCYKLLLNSVIGRCSMSEKSACSMTQFINGDNSFKYDQNLYLQIQQPQLPPVGRLVRLTAMVTQRARCYLDQLAEKAGYHNVLYCDTDSLMITRQGYQRLGSPGTKASQLGAFKRQTVKGNVNPYYTKGYFKNRKDYILQYTNQQGQIKYLHKAKGIPKKYITDRYSRDMAAQIQAFSRIRSVQLPPETHIPLGPSIQMKVWTKDFKGKGIQVKKMIKSSNLITDRLFLFPNDVGIPRSYMRYQQLGQQLS